MIAISGVWRRGALAASLILVLTGCGPKGTAQMEAAPPSEKQDPELVTASPQLLEQLKVGEPIWAEVADSLSVPGRFEVNETRVARVGSSVSGRITRLTVTEGQSVRRGQVLASLHSPELSDAQLAFLRAHSQQELAQRAATRAKELLQAEVIAVAEVQRREADLAQASAAVSSARDQLAALGTRKDQMDRLETTHEVDSESELIANLDGIVLERKVTVGQVVQSAETAFVLADLSNVWLVADVPEQAAGDVHAGKTVEATVPALPDEVVKGTLSFVSAMVNPETRSVRVRMELPNPQRVGSSRLYKPAMLASMRLEGRPERRLLVPGSAVVRDGNRDFVFVESGPATFRAREVRLGGEFGDRRVLMGGVGERDRIVLDGAFHLNNERKKSALDAH